MDKTIEIYCCCLRAIRKRWTRLFLTGICLLYIGYGEAQSGFAPAHGEVGNSSYTIGQVFYQQHAQGLGVSEGAEQSYLIITQLQDEVCEGTSFAGYGFEYHEVMGPDAMVFVF